MYLSHNLLHKDIIFKWDDQCQKAFDLLKTYLMNPPMLVPLVSQKPLLLYISLMDKSIRALLAHENNQGKEQAIYYISHTLVNYELNYSFIEKSCLAVVFASQKLHHYPPTHKVKLISKLILSNTFLAR